MKCFTQKDCFFFFFLLEPVMKLGTFVSSFCLCISFASGWVFVGKEDYNKDKTDVMKLIYMICKLSPFLFDFGNINNCFCNKELNVFREVFQYIFLREVQYWQARNTGKGKPELLWSEMYHWTFASGFHGRNVSWLQR